MPKSKDDISALFRSLGPGDANPQASIDVATREAEQRWPLLKAIAPKNPGPVTALTAEEKMRWVCPETPPEHTERKPALSLPGLGDKLTKSLSKMVARTVGTSVEPAVPVENEPVAEKTPGDLRRFASPQLLHPRTDHSTAEEPLADDSLEKIFSRLAGREAPASPAPRKKSPLLSRLGKR